MQIEADPDNNEGDESELDEEKSEEMTQSADNP